MRMWMVNPKIMCRQHLLGEHLEIHYLLGHLNKGYQIEGFITGNLLEPRSIYTRHNDLVKEMENRGYNHNSELGELNELGLNTVSKYRDFKVNKYKSQLELYSRCPQCRFQGRKQ